MGVLDTGKEYWRKGSVYVYYTYLEAFTSAVIAIRFSMGFFPHFKANFNPSSDGNYLRSSPITAFSLDKFNKMIASSSPSFFAFSLITSNYMHTTMNLLLS